MDAQRLHLPAFGEPSSDKCFWGRELRRSDLPSALPLSSPLLSPSSPPLSLPTSGPSASPGTWEQKRRPLPSAQDVLVATMAGNRLAPEGPWTHRVSAVVLAVVTFSSPPLEEA